MNNFLLDRRNAVLISAVLVIAAIFSGSLRSLDKARSDADRYFRNGDGVASLSGDLEHKSALAANTATLWGKHNSESSPETKKLESLRKTLVSDSADISEKYGASLELTNEMNSLIEKMRLLNMPDTDRRALESLQSDLTQTDNILKHTDYNSYAETLNKKISSFPISIFKGLMGVKNIPYFGPNT